MLNPMFIRDKLHSLVTIYFYSLLFYTLFNDTGVLPASIFVTVIMFFLLSVGVFVGSDIRIKIHLQNL